MSDQLTDESPFPFGAHKGKKWLSDWPQVADYIDRNKKAIDWELRRSNLL